MSTFDKTYHNLLEDILSNGKTKGDRTGTGTLSVFKREIRFDMSEGFPLLTTKKMFTRGVIEELLWFLNGDTNIKSLVDKGVHIWNGDAYKNYVKTEEQSYESMRNDPVLDIQPLELLSKEEFIEKIKTDENFAKQHGELGPVYGKQWVDWTTNDYSEMRIHTYGINQIQNAIDTLNNDPDSRRNMVNAWNVGEINEMVLPPCHYGFQLYTYEMDYKERIEEWCKSLGKSLYYADNMTEEKLNEINFPKRKISLNWNQRSVDTPLGLPFNIASYGFLLHMFAQQANMIPDELIGSLGDTHIYSNQIDEIKEQLKRDTDKYKAPKLKLNKAKDIFSYSIDDFEILDYESYPTIKMLLSN
jgi:thymidylate synthase